MEEIKERNLLRNGTLLGIAHIIGFTSIVFMLLFSIFTLGKMDEDLLSLLSQVVAGISVIIIYHFMMKERFINEFKAFKKKDTYIQIIIYLAASFFCLILISIIISTFFPDISLSNTNEDTLDSYRKYFPLYFTFVVIVAPIIEELVFRYFVFNYLAKKNLILAFVVVVGAFAMIHLLSSFNSTTDLNKVVDNVIYFKAGKSYIYIPLGALLTLPGYLLPSFFLTFSYYKTKSLAVPIGIHFLNNLLAASTFVILIGFMG